MSYVMVPVPEEHVMEVMQFVLRTATRAALQPWDEGSVQELFFAVDEPSRSLLSVVSRSSLAGKELSESDAAAFMELSARETMGIFRELNERAVSMSRQQILVQRPVTETLPNGRTTEKRVFAMPEDIAKLVRMAEEVEQASVPHPLTGDAG
jgi:hypothetical protein